MTVVLKGTSVGVVTDVDGHFKMDLPADHETVLVFSFVGMKTQEVYYKGEKELNVVMEEDVKQMDEVVVTGIFSKSKESYTGAVSVITEKELKSFGNRNILTTLRNIDPSFNILKVTNGVLTRTVCRKCRSAEQPTCRTSTSYKAIRRRN